MENYPVMRGLLINCTRANCMFQDSYLFANDSSGVITHDVGAEGIDLATTSTENDQHTYQQPGHAEESLEDLITSCAFFNPVSSQSSVDCRIDVLTIIHPRLRSGSRYLRNFASLHHTDSFRCHSIL